MGTEMVVTRYKNPGKHLGLRLALVTDLHNCDHTTLVQMLREEHPDAILCAGDILERHESGMSEWTTRIIEKWMFSIGKPKLSERIMWRIDQLVEGVGSISDRQEDTAIHFLREASDIAPVFYSLGNHEWYLTGEDKRLFAEQIITVLDNSDCEADVGGNQMRLGGLSIRYDLQWLKEFSEKSGFKILLCHQPDYYRKAIQGTPLDTFDLIVGGHFHGGQWRFFNRSVYVPRKGVLLKDAVGQFDRLVISAGAANTTRFPRYGNPCELVMISL